MLTVVKWSQNSSAPPALFHQSGTSWHILGSNYANQSIKGGNSRTHGDFPSVGRSESVSVSEVFKQECLHPGLQGPARLVQARTHLGIYIKIFPLPQSGLVCVQSELPAH